MDNIELLKLFGERLTNIMQSKQYISKRSHAGVDYHKLAKHCDVSSQMARKYVLGEAMPDPIVLTKIAKWLNVTPGWLLFGEQKNMKTFVSNNKPSLVIDLDTLRELLLQMEDLVKSATRSYEEIIDYALDVLYDVTKISDSSKTREELIRIAISSAMRFSEKQVS